MRDAHSMPLGFDNMNFPSIISPIQLYSLVELAAGTPAGAWVEVGVYKGGSAAALYQVARVQKRELHLFDTFTGTPFCADELDKHLVDREFAAETTPDLIRAFMPRAKLYVGVYPDTHPEGLSNVAFVHCDCDQYQSYRSVIDRLWPLVVPGGVMLFDDYPYLVGAKRAVEETFKLSELRLCYQRYYVQKESRS